jgi:hypothetical protein
MAWTTFDEGFILFLIFRFLTHVRTTNVFVCESTVSTTTPVLGGHRETLAAASGHLPSPPFGERGQAKPTRAAEEEPFHPRMARRRR